VDLVEPVLPLSIVLSVVGGATAGFLTLGRKFEDVERRNSERFLGLDKRVDKVELRLARDYYSKSDLQHVFERLEDRIDRIDTKLDKILLGYDKNAPSSK
jgi:hypothetical protein|tara:strand:+ start:372 stop:671 length:300 start_codon:yes stop_codon:yes gene_type:complete